MSIEFKSGEFQDFRATTKFHLGSVGKDILEGDVVKFDGQVLKLGGAEHALSGIQAAVKSGWLVPVSDTTSKYQPRSSSPTMRPALPSKDGRLATKTVADEERDLGAIKKVRDRGDGIVKKSAVIREDASDAEGIPVGKIRTPAVQKTALTAENATRIAQNIQSVDNVNGTSARVVDPVVKVTASGDVDEVVVGDEVEDLLPNAATSAKPAPGPAGEGDAPHLTSEEKTAKAASAAEKARQARLAQVGKVATPPVAKPAPEVEALPDDLEGRVEIVRLVIPDFAWDMGRQWRVRLKELLEKRDDPLLFMGILAVETDAVRKHVAVALKKTA